MMLLALSSTTWGASHTVDSLARATLEGYWAARASGSDASDVHDSNNSDGWTRGPLYRIRAVETRDEQGQSLARFAGRTWYGVAASAEMIGRIQGELQRILAQDGFVFAEIQTRPRVDSTGAPWVDLSFEIKKGAAYKLGNPLIREGRTRPDVARRLALWEEGENFEPDRIVRGTARLRRLGYFESADAVGLFRDSTRYVLYPVLALPDAHANLIGGLLGYDSEADQGGQLTGFLDIRLVNLRGTARDFEFSFASQTGKEREVRAAYTEPWILGTPVGARWEGRFLQQDSVFWEWSQSLFAFRDLDFYSRIEAEVGAQANRNLILETSTSALLSGVHVVRDSRDRVPLTRRGVRFRTGVTGIRRNLNAAQTMTNTASGSNIDSVYYLAQTRLAVEVWQPITDRFGIKTGFSSATNAPLNRLNRGELYDIGGARTLRGYREREYQTNAYFIGDAELQYAVGRRGRLFGFASPGLVNRPVGHFDFRRVLGYGAGLEVSQGDWSVALTYALNPERSFGNGFLHAAVENRF